MAVQGGVKDYDGQDKSETRTTLTATAPKTDTNGRCKVQGDCEAAKAPRMYFKPCRWHKSSPKQYVRQRADVSLDLHVRFSMHESFKFDWQLRNNLRARSIRLEGNVVHLLRICRSRSKSIESVQFSSKRSDSQRSLVRIRFCAHGHLKTDRQSRRWHI